MKASTVREFGKPLGVDEVLCLNPTAVEACRLDDINDIFMRRRAGRIEGRVVLDMNA